MNERPYIRYVYQSRWRRSGLMVYALDSGSGGPGSRPGWNRFVVFFGKTLYSHSESLQEYKWVLAICWGKLKECWVVTCDWLASHPGGVAILLAASCFRTNLAYLSAYGLSSPRVYWFSVAEYPTSVLGLRKFIGLNSFLFFFFFFLGGGGGPRM